MKHHPSLWSQTVSLPRFESLKGAVSTDVLIIGGGICGILCAYYLHQAGIPYLLAEGGRICGGETQNTTAKITSQHGLIYHQLAKKEGSERAGLYLSAQQEALQEYQTLCQSIDCDYEEKTAYLYSLTNRDKLENEVLTLNRLGFPARLTEQPNLPFQTAGAVAFDHQAQFHPLKFIAAIAQNLNIYEDTFVQKIRGKQAVTNHGTITAKQIIVATHFPFLNKHGGYFVKLYQHRSYVLALEQGPDLDGMYLDEAQNGLSFRNYKNYLLLGGGGHKTGKEGGGWIALRTFAQQFYPSLQERYTWAAQDCMPLDNIPYIGRYSKSTPHLFTATGFHKWGMTSSMAAALLLRDLILERDNPYRELFSPQRRMRKAQLMVNGANAVTNLVTPTAPRCPHLGCALKWNKAEHSWDCPCHGSRFAQDGTLLDNPATGGISPEK
ncbi:MAG: FAD-dependent oxidoreductase [Clostridia bacterium]|nr:FAD-dependent oxidoreductase [Clostridia bacterium]